MTGMLLTGALATKAVNPGGADGLLYGGTDLFLHHVGALALVACFSLVASWLIYRMVAMVLHLRVSPEQETLGLDLSQHGESAEPQRATGEALA
jgi:Amt family ammonium transporter